MFQRRGDERPETLFFFFFLCCNENRRVLAGYDGSCCTSVVKGAEISRLVPKRTFFRKMGLGVPDSMYWYPVRTVLVEQSRTTLFFFFSPSHMLSSPFFFSLPLSRNSDPGSHMYDSRLFSPLPATVRAFHVYLDKTPTLSSLVDSRRIAPTHVIHRYSHHFIPFIFLLIIKSKSHHGGIRTPLATILIAAFEGNH